MKSSNGSFLQPTGTATDARTVVPSVIMSTVTPAGRSCRWSKIHPNGRTGYCIRLSDSGDVMRRGLLPRPYWLLISGCLGMMGLLPSRPPRIPQTGWFGFTDTYYCYPLRGLEHRIFWARRWRGTSTNNRPRPACKKIIIIIFLKREIQTFHDFYINSKALTTK